MKFRNLFRNLLLPVNLQLESECVRELRHRLSEITGEEEVDQALWLEGQLADWEDSGIASPNFVDIVKRLIEAGNTDYAETIRDNYFAAHEELVCNQLVSPALARSFLSHLLLICRLADDERMSSAQISQVLGAMNPSVGFGRRSVEAVLKKLRRAPSLTPGYISNVFESDREYASEYFGDATLSHCIEIAHDASLKLGFNGDLKSTLSTLLVENEVDRYTPYIQILHYQCSILEYYDHHVKDFYEFSPRGVAATALFEKYPESMVSARNPFLNNAKSVAQINFPWAAAKKNREFPGAAALFSILNKLDSMGYAARKELALWIRCTIHRFIVLASPIQTPLPETLTLAQCNRLISAIGAQNTSTRGILEQRLVDAISKQIHTEDEGWISRGIGDSVNASNVSRKKLGDCDFQDVSNKSVIAYEAHAGILTQTYLLEHLKVLPKSTQPRIDEWKTYSNPSEWIVKIVFVAHEFRADLPDDFSIDGVQFSVECVLYSDFIERFSDATKIDFINNYLLKQLSEKNTPSVVRQKLIELMG